MSQAASTDPARPPGAACGVDLEVVLHLVHLHARVTQAPGSVVDCSPRVSERWSEVALDMEPLGHEAKLTVIHDGVGRDYRGRNGQRRLAKVLSELSLQLDADQLVVRTRAERLRR